MGAITALGIPLVLFLGGRGAAVASVAASVAVWIASHAFAARDGGRPPAFATALAPGALALVVIAGIHVLGLARWSAGLGAVIFAAAAPFLDRKLLPDLAWLGATRLGTLPGAPVAGLAAAQRADQ